MPSRMPSLPWYLLLSIVQANRFDSGFIDISANGTSGSMFYWFFPPRNNDADAPFVLWLQGGPGASGMLGCLKELGPVEILNGSLSPRESTWCEEFACLFVDQPLGTGYSVAREYATSEEGVASGLYDFLSRFFRMPAHQAWAANDFYIAGESYGGHFVPSLAYYILDAQQGASSSSSSSSSEEVTLNLKGIAIGDGFTDPQTQVLAKPLQAYNLGIIDRPTYAEAEALARNASALARRGRFREAHVARTAMEQLVHNASGVNYYDVREFGDYDFTDVEAFLNAGDTKAMLGVPAEVPHRTDPEVKRSLEPDIMRSHAWKFPRLLASLRVLLYQGQFDWKDGVPSNERWLEALQWSGRGAYIAAPRRIWRGEGGRIYGWVTDASAVNLTEVVVAGAGHLVPMNQPESSKDMITKFIREQSFA
eukprot:CAMPEP_0170173916 /NCGR_PEP_ID=MMETSP0040_2-20121228/7181_1 /TAXON_ID=641309 /ORGANISM="Lotharella oceanica, Strain CCMP622" /LENGTH=421 /DNA_ID=CAMNT_0010415331 /DNA_START=36 /DNA_END=1301 /DNA_ORIENTATION=+